MTNAAILIPTLGAARHLPALTAALARQRLRPRQVIVIDSSSSDATVALARAAGWDVTVIPRSEFNHGGTRNRAARRCLAGIDVLVFMTQDALPVDDDFLGNLVRPIVAGEAQAAFARQIPYPDAQLPEVFARGLNYPAAPSRRTRADIDRLGIRAFFFSNVASAIDRATFDRLGGFPDDVVMNEDMLFCAKLLRDGGTVAYAAEAVVRHSHNYSIGQQFRRYFDIGAFLAASGPLLAGARSGGQGAAYVARLLAWLVRRGAIDEVPRAVVESAAKWLAFQLGRRGDRLSRGLKRRLSLHRAYW
ncbi:MAG TPA: glycosyltransferase [Planctomycetota bacterium]|nr:glycosyltransferase [Planctomycetota bacterium]